MSLYEFQSAVVNKLRQYSTKAFFDNCYRFKVFLKTDTNFSPCLYRFVPVL
jgi:hypothetical protein